MDVEQDRGVGGAKLVHRGAHDLHILMLYTGCECESVSADPELSGANRPPGKSDPHLWLWVPSLRCASHEGQGSQVQGGGRGSPHFHFKQRGRRCNVQDPQVALVNGPGQGRRCLGLGPGLLSGSHPSDMWWSASYTCTRTCLVHGHRPLWWL